MNTNFPTRDSTPMLVQMPLSMGAPTYERSSPRDLVYDVATAKNPDGSKKYQLDVATNTLVTKVNFDTTGAKPKATGVDYLFGESLYRADPRASLTEDGGIPGSVSATREVSFRSLPQPVDFQFLNVFELGHSVRRHFQHSSNPQAFRCGPRRRVGEVQDSPRKELARCWHQPSG